MCVIVVFCDSSSDMLLKCVIVTDLKINIARQWFSNLA